MRTGGINVLDLFDLYVISKASSDIRIGLEAELMIHIQYIIFMHCCILGNSLGITMIVVVNISDIFPCLVNCNW